MLKPKVPEFSANRSTFPKISYLTYIKIDQVPLFDASNNHILNTQTVFCIKKIKTFKVRVIIFHMETYINTCHMCKTSLKQSLWGRHQG